MMTIGVDYHPSFQQIAFMDQEPELRPQLPEPIRGRGYRACIYPLADSSCIVPWVYATQQALLSLRAWAQPGSELLAGAAATVVAAGCVFV